MPSRSLSEPQWFGKRVAAILSDASNASYAGNQATLGRALGISQQQVSRLLGGIVVINVDQLQLLCDELGLNSRDVLGDAEHAWRVHLASQNPPD